MTTQLMPLDDAELNAVVGGAWAPSTSIVVGPYPYPYPCPPSPGGGGGRPLSDDDRLLDLSGG